MEVVTPYSIAFIKTNLINGLTPRIKVIYNDFQKKWRNGASHGRKIILPTFLL